MVTSIKWLLLQLDRNLYLTLRVIVKVCIYIRVASKMEEPDNIQTEEAESVELLAEGEMPSGDTVAAAEEATDSYQDVSLLFV